MRRAKIVCTLGPAVGTPEMVAELVEAGMNVARLNFSHGSYDDHAAAYARVRAASDATGRGVAILADLQGPKIRLGRFEHGPVQWRAGDQVVITTDAVPGSKERVSTTYAGLPADVTVGDRVLVDDGNVGLTVLAVDGPDVRCEVTEGGLVSDNKGLNLPGVSVSAPALTEKDEADLRYALTLRVDMVALSFVRSASDVDRVRQILAECDASEVPVFAKIEKPEAIDDLAAIVTAFDGIMVARGDLGVEVELERVPLVQKRCIQMCRENAKPVIVATQVLDSMISHSRPTRAEASDCANAVWDGTDALMLSGETSVGAYPVQSVRTMGRIIAAAEDGALEIVPPVHTRPRTRGGAIAKAATEVGTALGARAIVAFTQTGDTARRLARHRVSIPLLAFTPVAAVRSQLAISWGVETFLVPSVSTTDEMVGQVERAMLSLGRGQKGDLIVVVAGSPPNTPGSTNLLRVHRLGDALHVPAT